MQHTYDAIIIGAGISGAAIAFELSKKGYKTINVDKLEAAGYGSTANTCAIIRTHYSTLEGTAIAYDSYFDWKNWSDYIGVTDEKGLAKFIETSGIVIKDKSFDLSRYLKSHDILKIPYEIWDREKLLEIMPHFVDESFFPPQRPEDPDFEKSPADKINPNVIFVPNAGYINDAVLSVHNIQRAAEAKGAQFIFEAEVTEIRAEGGKVAGVTLKDGRKLDAPVVVNAAGPHSFIINRLAGVEDGMKIKTRALRHEVHYVPSPASFSQDEDGRYVSDGDAGGYHRPEAGNLILIGSEDPECDSHEWVDDPDNYNQNVTQAQWNAQVYRLAKRIPELPIPNQPKGIVDLYDVSDDWVPIYDKSDLPGFYLAIGTSGNQYKNGPAIGRMLAEIIDACEKGHDHDLEPVQLKLHNIDFTLSMGVFSRNREIIEGSTFSVLG